MLANLACWVIAIALILSNSATQTELFIKLAFALGFIFMGICSKAVEAWQDIRTKSLSIEAAKVVGTNTKTETR